MMFQISNFSKLLLILAYLFFLPVQLNAQTVNADQWLKQLESSGALDRAVQNSLERLRQKSIAAQKLEQEKLEKQKLELAKNARKVDPKVDFIYGDPDASISIIEYSDFECPFCQRFNDVPKELAKEMPKQVNVVWRNFPLSFHNPMAFIEAGAAMCAGKLAGNDVFWKYADAIFKNSRLNGQGMPVEGGVDPLFKLAKSFGIDSDQFSSCLNSTEMQKRINDDIQDGVISGINGTPGVILINHRTGKVDRLEGAVPLELLRDIVKNLLTR